MNQGTLREAMKAAHDFLAAANKLEHQKISDYPSKERAAVKRKSMDLTRALAEMRRPG